MTGVLRSRSTVRVAWSTVSLAMSNISPAMAWSALGVVRSLTLPRGLACRRGYEGRNVKPIETMMAMCDRTLADRRPDTARNRLQADAMLVRGEDLDRLSRVLCGLLDNGVRKLFLNEAASAGEPDFGFFGRGFWIDHPIAFKASHPRCAATDVRPSSSAIHAATLRLHPRPPSGGGFGS